MKKAEPEHIVLLDPSGKPVGSAPKLASHHRNTPLHLAFSTYIFKSDGKLLVTRRADTKKVWNGVWTNSCCGHPAPNETMQEAIERRVKYELGMTITDIKLVVPFYRYITPPFNGVVEHEVCPIYFARSAGSTKIFQEEVADYQWIEWKKYVQLISNDHSEAWSWWCKDQLKHLDGIKELSQYATATLAP